MAIGENYATLPELKSYLRIDNTTDDSELTDALTSASRGIDKYCDRSFGKDTSATARVYYPDDACVVRVDDFHTTTGLIVKTDSGDDGTYETTWLVTDFQLEPLNGIVDGEIGWPFTRVRAVVGNFPVGARRAAVEVTAQWGWAAVPASVKQSCLIMAAETFKLRDAPFGIAGFGDFGMVRVRDNPMARAKLDPYRRDAVMVG